MQKDPFLAHSLHRLHSVNGQGHRLCNELDANQKRIVALVKACGLHKAPLSYGREQLVAHLVINMTVLSRPALWKHAVVRLGGFRNQTQDAGLPIRYVWERHSRSVDSLPHCPSSICATGHICKMEFLCKGSLFLKALPGNGLFFLRPYREMPNKLC
jgi:hypothetical protein